LVERQRDPVFNMASTAVPATRIGRLREHEHDVRPRHVGEVVVGERAGRRDGVCVPLPVPLVGLGQPSRVDGEPPRAEGVGIPIELVATAEPSSQIDARHSSVLTVIPNPPTMQMTAHTARASGLNQVKGWWWTASRNRTMAPKPTRKLSVVKISSGCNRLT